SAVYLFLYLSRWEWNRAMIAGLVLVASETALFAGAILVRIERLEERLDQRQDDPVPQELRATRGTTENRFDWLAPPDRLGVFIPVLLGAGAVISALAWVVERVARLTVGRATEHVLAMRLSVLRLPDSLVGP